MPKRSYHTVNESPSSSNEDDSDVEELSDDDDDDDDDEEEESIEIAAPSKRPKTKSKKRRI